MTSGQILELLRNRHHEDVFVPECKDGPSQGSTHLRLDAWSMKKSWTNPLVCGYEIKVSRADFVGDDKWHLYLPYCHELYFVCPPKLIEPSELPAEVGLLYASSTGSRLFAKKKAARRSVAIPETVYQYILMCRAKITRRWSDVEQDNRAEWKDWLAQTMEDRELGRAVGKAIRETIQTRVVQVDRENQRLQRQIADLQAIRDLLAKLGINESYALWNIERRIKDMRQIIPPELRRAIDGMRRSVEELDRRVTEAAEPQLEESNRGGTE